VIQEDVDWVFHEADALVSSPVQVVFAVEDVARSVEFYERAFGWPRNDRIDYEE
jgi:predicted enzyme related to lactoylglutathione lyase